MTEFSSNKRIAKNTLFLFLRTVLVMGISLYTSRLILSILGVSDYGIYNVVGGLVSMLAFLNSAMVQASQRYLTFSQARDLNFQKRVFSTSVLIHLTIAFVVVLLLETIGLWYLNNEMVIPLERKFAANVIYQFSVFIFLSRILVVPYTASVIAHERMDIYAYVSLFDYALQLLLVFLLQCIDYDKLIVYGAMMLLVAVLYYFCYYYYARNKLSECRFTWFKDYALYKEMFSFASWAFLGGAGFVARNQGVNLVLNIMCGTVVNAARGVAYQVSTAILTLTGSFQQALNPQITKRYAAGDIESMMLLVKAGAKYSFLLLLVCFVPIIVRPNYVLQLWLGEVPEYAAGFLVMAIIMSLVTAMDGTLNTAMQATGDIRLFQIVVSVIMCSDIPLSYYFLSLGIVPYWVTLVSVVTAVLCLLAKIILLRMHIRFNLVHFLMTVVIKNILIAAVVISIFLFIEQFIPDNFVGFMIVCFLSLLVTGGIIYFIGFNRSERKHFYTMLEGVFQKFKR